MAASHALYQLSYGPVFLLLSALMLRCASEPSSHTGDNLPPSGPCLGTEPQRGEGRPTNMQTDRTAPSVTAGIGAPGPAPTKAPWPHPKPKSK